MKKEIVIVDDRPWKMKKSIQKLKSDEIKFHSSIYYPNNMLDKARQDQLMEDYKKETHVKVIQVNSQKEFIAEMDKLYGSVCCFLYGL